MKDNFDIRSVIKEAPKGKKPLTFNVVYNAGAFKRPGKLQIFYWQNERAIVFLGGLIFLILFWYVIYLCLR